ncbi:hypothetical protein GN244_ATG13650 [Phytophthora infestans]|uniref:Uncharacterized protein n=1 Tax=Phytophthora infestans TaxID=4787 RepID=A0A833W965_PHYIN|nr:hypothetical protein GN244_ATG13650 [Phytophthora infestans]KAF4133554.1 hypothetical protein GN958_ATG17252 [Phytophthora infestans]
MEVHAVSQHALRIARTNLDSDQAAIASLVSQRKLPSRKKSPKHPLSRLMKIAGFVVAAALATSSAFAVDSPALRALADATEADLQPPADDPLESADQQEWWGRPDWGHRGGGWGHHHHHRHWGWGRGRRW